MASAVAAYELSRSFPGRKGRPATEALDGLTFSADAGEVVALLGPNGAGKTTTVRILNGILRPDGGYARVLGFDPAVAGDVVRSRTGVLTENAGLDDRLTALENVAFAAVMRGVDAPTAERRSLDMLERFGMAGRSRDLVRGFSTGQRKRVALARALLHDPDVLFLDEPTSGLDPAATREVLDVIAALARDRGRTVLLCTHFLHEAERLCQRMAVLEKGRLLAFGTPASLAAEFAPGLAVDIDLGGPADPAIMHSLLDVRGVLHAESAPKGAHLRVEERAVVPSIVAALVAREIPLFAVEPHGASFEDLYFAITAR